MLTMEVNKSHIIVGCSALAVGLIAGLLLRGCSGKELPEDPEPIVLTDTIRVTDTLRIAEHTKPLYVIKWDTLYLENPASPDIVRDSLCDGYVTIPITQSEYRDTFATDSTKAEIAVLFSGYNAKIDSIGLTYEATIQPKVYVKKKGWGQFVGIGVGAGYGASVVGSQVFAAPQIGVSIVYGFGYHW